MYSTPLAANHYCTVLYVHTVCSAVPRQCAEEYRQLSERGDSPTAPWLSRNLWPGWPGWQRWMRHCVRFD